MESHLNLALCSLEVTQNEVKDQSNKIERLTSIFTDQSQQIASLMAKNVEQSEQMERVMSAYNDQSQQLSDQSRKIDNLRAKDMNQSQKIKRLISSLEDRSQQIASLTSTVQSLAQQIERLKGQDQYQTMQGKETTNEAKGAPNKKRATNVKVEEGKFLKNCE